MKRPTRKAKAKTPRVKRLSRSTLNEALRDLAERLGRQLERHEAIVAANEPNDKHTEIEYRLRTVFGVLLDSQLRGLREIEGFAQIICERVRAGMRRHYSSAESAIIMDRLPQDGTGWHTARRLSRPLP